jgi:hypothetical protein
VTSRAGRRGAAGGAARWARWARLAALALGLTVGARAAAADDYEVKKMRFAERKDKLVVSAAFTEIFDKKAYDKLGNGFPSVLIARMYVYRHDGSAPIAVSGATFRLVYDLWEEAYTIRIDSPLGRKDLVVTRRADALVHVTTLDEFPIAALADIEIGPHYYFLMQIQLNPVSDEELAEMRRWLSRPAGATSIDRGSSFFGSIVSVFVNPKLPEADRVLRLRSQDFYRVER